MIRRSLAALILGPSLLVASLSWSGFVALQTVFDPDRSREVAEELLDNDEVRAQLTSNLGAAIESAVPDDVPLTAEQVDVAAAGVLEDPAVEALILSALDSTHGAFLGEGSAPTTLSLGSVTESLRASIIEAVPQAEGQIPELGPVEVTLPTDRIPNASPLRTFLQRMVPIGALVAAIGVVAALLTTSDRPTVLRRAGIWAIGAATFSLVVGLGLPELLRRFAPEQAEVVAALFAAMLRSVVVPSIVLAVGGVALLVLSAIGGAVREGRRAPGGPQAPGPGGRTEARGTPAGPVPHAAHQVNAPPPPSPYVSHQAYAPPPPPHAASPPPASPPPPPPPPPSRPVVPPAIPMGPASSPTTVMPPVPGPAPGWSEGARPAASPPPPAEPPRGPRLPPRWVEGHGWAMHPQDPGPPPPDATWVAGVGYLLADQSAPPPSDPV
ncbi:MAG: hypothetical protein AAGA17_12240 [Actinomycetota bacterium]